MVSSTRLSFFFNHENTLHCLYNKESITSHLCVIKIAVKCMSATENAPVPTLVVVKDLQRNWVSSKVSADLILTKQFISKTEHIHLVYKQFKIQNLSYRIGYKNVFTFHTQSFMCT